MQNQHRIADSSARIFLRRAQRVVVQLDLRQFLSGLELKIFYDERARLRRGIVGGENGDGCKGDEQRKNNAADFHGTLPETEKIKSWKQTRKGRSKLELRTKVSPILIIRYTIYLI